MCQVDMFLTIFMIKTEVGSMVGLGSKLFFF